MCSDLAIKVEGLSKCFHIYNSPQDRLLQMLRRGKKKYYREFWALKNVSFNVRKGETVGIVGRNGSGKSTLLQMICGTITPTGGMVSTYGRVAALLELGAGFNPEFSGRDNVYMNAAVLGLTKDEIESRFRDIEDFAEIGDFIDRPIKTYSSGMLVRLAFAVAINVEPQILIIDEALSVGDELFQRKCFAKIESIKSAGATILFVSHSGSTVVDLCDRAILLDAGEKLVEDRPKSVIGKYQRLLYAPTEKIGAIRASLLANVAKNHADTTSSSDSDERVSLLAGAASDSGLEFYDPELLSKSVLAYETRGAEIINPRILNEKNQVVNCVRRGGTYRYVYDAKFTTSASIVRFGMMIKTLSGVELGGATDSTGLQSALPHIERDSNVEVEFTFQCNLTPGAYFLNAGISGSIDGEETYLHRILDACLFKVLPEDNVLATGVVDFKCKPNIRISVLK